MKKINILIIGKNSLLAKNYKKLSKIKNITIIDRFSINRLNLNKYTHIINFSFDQNLKKKSINFKNQLDEKISKKIKDKGIIYIMPSTRLVYSNLNKSIFKETNKISKIDNIYGKNKRKIELRLFKVLKRNVLILRISTILFFDKSSKDLFISRVLRSLKKRDKVFFDIHMNTAKDFITIDKFSEALDKLIFARKTGIFNISSGFPIKIKSIIKKIILGFGSGQTVYTTLKKSNSYCLDNKKLSKNIKFSITKEHIFKYCVSLGKKLNA